MSGPTLTMRQTAAALGLSYERFRKIWRDLPGFPAPFLARRWDGAAVEAWKTARSARNVVVAVPPPSAPPAAPDPGAARRGREQLARLRAG